MGRTSRRRQKHEESATSNSQMKPKVVRALSPDITDFRTSRRPKNPVVTIRKVDVDLRVPSPLVAIEPETFDTPTPCESMALAQSKSNSLDEFVKRTLISWNLVGGPAGPITGNDDDTRLQLLDPLPNFIKSSDISGELLNRLSFGDDHESEVIGTNDVDKDYAGDGRDSDDDSSCVESSTGDLTTEESDEDHFEESESDDEANIEESESGEEEEHTEGLEWLHEGHPSKINVSASTYPKTETLPLDSCDDEENVTAPPNVSTDDEKYNKRLLSHNPSSEVFSDLKKTSLKISGFATTTINDGVISSPVSAARPVPHADIRSSNIKPQSSPSNIDTNEKDPLEINSIGSIDENFISGDIDPFKSPSPEPSVEDPDSSLPENPESPIENEENCPSANFSENFSDCMSLSTLGSFGSSLLYSKETVPTIFTLKREVPLEGEGDPFAAVGINLQNLLPGFAVSGDMNIAPAVSEQPSPSPEISQSSLPSSRRNSWSCPVLDSYDNSPIQSTTLSTSCSLLIENLDQLHKSAGTSQRSSALFGAPLLSAHNLIPPAISDCHVSSTQEYSISNANNDFRTTTLSPRKRILSNDSQIVTVRSDNDSDEGEIFARQQEVADNFEKDVDEDSDSEQDAEVISIWQHGLTKLLPESEVSAKDCMEDDANEIACLGASEIMPILSPQLLLNPTQDEDHSLQKSDTEILLLADSATINVCSKPVLTPNILEGTTNQPSNFLPHAVSSNNQTLDENIFSDELPESESVSALLEEAIPGLNSNVSSENNSGVNAAAPLPSSTAQDHSVRPSNQAEKRRRPGPASKTRKNLATNAVASQPQELALVPMSSIAQQPTQTSATLDIAALKSMSISCNKSFVEMKPLAPGHSRNNKIWLYSPEHKQLLYGEDQFLVDREHLRNYEENSIPLWRIWKARRLLQKFVALKIDGRNFHQGVDEFRLLPDSEEQLYIKYQPVIFDLWVDTLSHQLGMFYNVAGSAPFLGYFSLTASLYNDFREFLEGMARRALSDKVKKDALLRKDTGSNQEVINDRLQEVIQAECFPLAFPIEVLIQTIEYPRLLSTRSQAKKNIHCCSCQRIGRLKPSHFKIVFDGELYDHVTLNLTNKEGRGMESGFQFCRLCFKYLNSFHRVVHYKFWLFIAFRMQLRKLYEELKDGQKFHPDDVLKFLTGDFHFNKMSFYEFQAVYSEGYHSKDRLQKEIVLLEKKNVSQKTVSGFKENSKDSADQVKQFRKYLISMFPKRNNSQSVRAIEASPVMPSVSSLASTGKSTSQKNINKKETSQQGKTQLAPAIGQSSVQSELSSGKMKTLGRGASSDGGSLLSRKVSRKRKISSPVRKVLKPESVATKQVERDTTESTSMLQKKTKLGATLFVPTKAMLKQMSCPILEPADSTTVTTNSTKKQIQRNNRKRPTGKGKQSKGSLPSSNVGAPRKQRKKLGSRKVKAESKNKRQSDAWLSDRDPEMEQVVETTKEISDFMEKLQHQEGYSSEVTSANSSLQDEEGGVFKLLSVEFVT